MALKVARSLGLASESGHSPIRVRPEMGSVTRIAAGRLLRGSVDTLMAQKAGLGKRGESPTQIRPERLGTNNAESPRRSSAG